MTSLDYMEELEKHRSAHASDVSASGIRVRTGHNVNLVYERLITDRQRECEPLAPPPREFKLRRVVRDTKTGEYRTIEAGVVRPVPNVKPVKSGRFGKSDLRGGALLDALFEGRLWDFNAGPDEDAIWEAARTLAEQEGMNGNEMRKLSELVQLAVLARGGVTHVRPENLP